MAEMRQTSVSPSVFPVFHQQFHMPLSKDYGKTQRNTQITDLSWFIIIFPPFQMAISRLSPSQQPLRRGTACASCAAIAFTVWRSF